MKTLALGVATVVLATVANLPACMAQTKVTAGNTWSGISQRTGTSAANTEATAPRFEYRYGYDRHAAWRGHWVLVR